MDFYPVDINTYVILLCNKTKQFVQLWNIFFQSPVKIHRVVNEVMFTNADAQRLTEDGEKVIM